MIMFGSSLPSALGWLVATKVYSGTGADIVMESISLVDPCEGVLSANALFRHLTRSDTAGNWQSEDGQEDIGSRQTRHCYIVGVMSEPPAITLLRIFTGQQSTSRD